MASPFLTPPILLYLSSNYDGHRIDMLFVISQAQTVFNTSVTRIISHMICRLMGPLACISLFSGIHEIPSWGKKCPDGLDGQWKVNEATATNKLNDAGLNETYDG